MSTEMLSIVIASAGVLTSAFLALLAYTLNRQSQRTAIHRSIGDLYEKLMEFRSAHPEVMKLAGLWDDSCFNSMYSQNSKKEQRWVTYYSFAELVLGFSNTVLYGWKSRALDKYAYENHYKHLIRLLLTEHYPFILTVKDGPYLSPLIKKFVSESEREGWDWQSRRRVLVMQETKKQVKKPSKN
jgi:hypothetical protein